MVYYRQVCGTIQIIVKNNNKILEYLKLVNNPTLELRTKKGFCNSTILSFMREQLILAPQGFSHLELRLSVIQA